MSTARKSQKDSNRLLNKEGCLGKVRLPSGVVLIGLETIAQVAAVQLKRSFNSAIQRNDFVHSYIREDVDGTVIGPEMHNSSKLGLYRNHIGIDSSGRESQNEQIQEQRREIKLLSKTI